MRRPIRQNLLAHFVFMRNEISCALVCSVPLCSTLEVSSGVDEMAREGRIEGGGGVAAASSWRENKLWRGILLQKG